MRLRRKRELEAEQKALQEEEVGETAAEANAEAEEAIVAVDGTAETNNGTAVEEAEPDAVKNSSIIMCME